MKYYLTTALLFLLSFAASATAPHSWSAPAGNWAIRALAPATLGDNIDAEVIDGCPVNPAWASDGDWGCPASDGGLTFEALVTGTGATWRNPAGKPYAVCQTILTTEASTGKKLVTVSRVFGTGADATGAAYWPTTWPTSVTCSKVVMAGVTHSYDSPITYITSNKRSNVITPLVTTTAVTTGNTCTISGTACSLTVPAAWVRGGVKSFNLPDGAYTGPATLDPVAAKTTVSGSTDFFGVYCMVTSTPNTSADDWLVVAADEASANGTAWCPVIFGGVAKRLPIVISTP